MAGTTISSSIVKIKVSQVGWIEQISFLGDLMSPTPWNAIENDLERNALVEMKA